MSALVRLFQELFGSNPAPDEEPATELVATLDLSDHQEENHVMRTDDQKIIALIFNDVYAQLAALTTTVKAQADTIASLSSAVDTLNADAEAHAPAFDTTLVPAYAPPAQTDTSTTDTDAPVVPAASAAPTTGAVALTDAQIAAAAAAQAGTSS